MPMTLLPKIYILMLKSEYNKFKNSLNFGSCMTQRRKSVADLSSNDFDLQENFKTRPFFSFSSHDMNPVIGHQTLLVVGTHQIWQHDLNKGVLSWNICGKVLSLIHI